VTVLGWTPRRTSQFATGSMTRKYPFFSQSGRIFMRVREGTSPRLVRGSNEKTVGKTTKPEACSGS
jgi:hypothetical protein